jgi:hypothetical protein
MCVMALRLGDCGRLNHNTAIVLIQIKQGGRHDYTNGYISGYIYLHSIGDLAFGYCRTNAIVPACTTTYVDRLYS